MHMKPSIEKVAIIGAGALGAAYGSILYEMDPRCVSFIANGARYDKLKRDGVVVNGGGTPLGGMQVRAEEKADPRIHHNDLTTLRGSPVLGYAFYDYAYSLRGLPPEAYRLTWPAPMER